MSDDLTVSQENAIANTSFNQRRTSLEDLSSRIISNANIQEDYFPVSVMMYKRRCEIAYLLKNPLKATQTKPVLLILSRSKMGWNGRELSKTAGTKAAADMPAKISISEVSINKSKLYESYRVEKYYGAIIKNNSHYGMIINYSDTLISCKFALGGSLASKIKIFYDPNGERPDGYMSECDTAISESGSTILYEFNIFVYDDCEYRGSQRSRANTPDNQKWHKLVKAKLISISKHRIVSALCDAMPECASSIKLDAMV